MRDDSTPEQPIPKGQFADDLRALYREEIEVPDWVDDRVLASAQRELRRRRRPWILRQPLALGSVAALLILGVLGVWVSFQLGSGGAPEPSWFFEELIDFFLACAHSPRILENPEPRSFPEFCREFFVFDVIGKCADALPVAAGLSGLAAGDPVGRTTMPQCGLCDLATLVPVECEQRRLFVEVVGVDRLQFASHLRVHAASPIG